MSLNFLIFFSYYIAILISILGYGFFILSFEKKNKNFFNLGYVGLIGIFFLIIYSYLSHIFIPHSKTHNLILILLGIINFVYFLFKNLDNPIFKKNLIFLTIIFFILSSSLLLEKNHDDFPYYHFAYTYNLTQESLNFGIGNLNHGFKTPSSIFYLNSLFYLPLADYYLFNFSAVFILGFANIILIKKALILNNEFKNKNDKINFFNYLSLLSLIFVNIFFYRISEHGTDRSAQILIFILLIYLLECFENESPSKVDLLLLYSLFGIIISLKSFYFLYFAFSVPFFLFILKKEKKISSALKTLLVNRYAFYLTLLFFLIILSYLTNTGCLIYPVTFTCFENFSWSISKEGVSQMNNWYELWSKAGANPNTRVQNPDQYIISFNWVSNWIDQYFFNKVSDLLFGIFFIFLILFVIFIKYEKKQNKIQISKLVKITYLTLLILFLEWFYNHPSLRYGGFCIIALIFFIPFSFYLDRVKIDLKRYSKIVLILIITSLSIFEIRNFKRIYNEINIYDYKPIEDTFYYIDGKYFDIQEKIEKLKNNNGLFSKSIF